MVMKKMLLFTRSGTGSNNPIQEQTVLLLPCPEEEAPSTHTNTHIDPLENVVPQSTPRKRIEIRKMLNPSGPSSNTRSKKLQVN
jgi:hypothetical protein